MNNTELSIKFVTTQFCVFRTNFYQTIKKYNTNMLSNYFLLLMFFKRTYKTDKCIEVQNGNKFIKLDCVFTHNQNYLYSALDLIKCAGFRCRHLTLTPYYSNGYIMCSLLVFCLSISNRKISLY